MRVGYDATAILGSPAGLGTYALHLLQHLVALDNEIEYVVYYRLPDLPDRVARRPNLTWRHTSLRSRTTCEQVWLPRVAAGDRLNALHSPAYGLPLWYRGTTIATAHDLSFLSFREPRWRLGYTLMAQLIPAALRRASLIIADSRYSAADVTARLDVPECRVRVVYPGIPEAGLAPSAPAERENVRRRLRLDGPYLLYVASFETRKNHATLVRAACRVREQGLAAKLVLVGRRGPQSAAIGRLIRRYALADRVIVPGYVKPAELHALYDGATATVYPSLYEGFGLPVVESMRRGVPAIAGDNTALAEVAGTAALMVDASSVDAIAEAVFRVLSDARLRAELVRRGRARAELFSWDKAARETTEVYRELGSGRSGPSANASSTRVGGVWHGNQRAGSGAGAGQPERHTCLPRAGGVPSVRGRRRSAGGAPRRGHEHLPVSPLRT